MKKTNKKLQPQTSNLQLLKINEPRFEMFLEGLDNYEFQVFQHPAAFREPIENKIFFEHFYGVLKMFVSQENDLSLGRILVLYGVGPFEAGASFRTETTDERFHSFFYVWDGAVLFRESGDRVRD